MQLALGGVACNWSEWPYCKARFALMQIGCEIPRIKFAWQETVTGLQWSRFTHLWAGHRAHSRRVLCLFGSVLGPNPSNNLDLKCWTGTHRTACCAPQPHIAWTQPNRASSDRGFSPHSLQTPSGMSKRRKEHSAPRKLTELYPSSRQQPSQDGAGRNTGAQRRGPADRNGQIH